MTQQRVSLSVQGKSLSVKLDVQPVLTAAPPGVNVVAGAALGQFKVNGSGNTQTQVWWIRWYTGATLPCGPATQPATPYGDPGGTLVGPSTTFDTGKDFHTDGMTADRFVEAHVWTLDADDGTLQKAKDDLEVNPMPAPPLAADGEAERGAPRRARGISR